MISKTTVTILIFVIIASTSAQSSEKCPNGRRFNDGCNNCRCNPETGLSSCTKKLCIPTNEYSDEIENKIQIKKRQVSNLDQCPEGIEEQTRFYHQKCGFYCYCAKNGLAICPRIACLEDRKDEESAFF